MTILINLILVVWSLVALLMILVILMQRPKSEGLGAAFGGGVTENIFGAQTTTVLTKITGWLAGIFFLLTFGLSVLYAHKSTQESALSRELKKTSGTAPAAVPSTSVPPALTTPGPSVPPSAGDVAAPGASVRPSDQAVGIVPPASAPVVQPSVAPSAAPTDAPPSHRHRKKP